MPLREVMKRSDVARGGIALGGIGTGSLELRKDGACYNWTIANNEPLFTGPKLDFSEPNMLFFVIRYQVEGDHPRLKLLQIENFEEEGALLAPVYYYPWLSGVDRIDSEFSFPFAKLKYTDAEMPFDVEMEASAPFIPHDVKNSTLPTAIFRFNIVAKTNKKVDVLLMASARNIVGYDLEEKVYTTRIEVNATATTVEMSCADIDTTHSSWGTMALSSLSGDSCYYAGWENRHPYYELLMQEKTLGNIDDTAGRNFLKKTDGSPKAGTRLFSTVARAATFTKKGDCLANTFTLSWHFPNLYADANAMERAGIAGKPNFEGHAYANDFADAFAVSRYVQANLDDLTTRTRAFHQQFMDSTLPQVVLDQVNSQLNTFVSSTWYTKAGNFGIMEGLTSYQSYGPLDTIDVGMYGSIAIAALYPELDKSMMRAHMRLQNKETGNICHGISKDFATHDVREAVGKRLDLPSQYAVMTLRGYFWTGDKAYLAETWDSVKAALEYILRERDMNGDLLPDMEGVMCSYDNFPMYGTAAYVAGQWLAALAYAAAAAKDIGDTAAAERYSDILAQAGATYEAKLWNGNYYRLYNDEDGPQGDKSEGCLTDQLIGQWAMDQVGLGYLVPKAHVRKALKSIMQMSYRDYGVVNCRWPEDDFLHDYAHQNSIWVDQANTCWTGVELGFASFLIFEGLTKEGLQVIKNVDDRYKKAQLYFDHQEFGGHYYRALSAWGIINAYLGLEIKGNAYTFAPRLPKADQTLFFAYGNGEATYQREHNGTDETITLAVHTGALEAGALTLALTDAKFAQVALKANGKAVAKSNYTAAFDGKQVTITLKDPVTIAAGKKLQIVVS